MALNVETGRRIGDLAITLYGSKTKFAEAMGITPQNLNHWICRGVKNSILELILFKHPNVSREWLYEGKGTPIIQNIQSDDKKQEEVEEVPRKKQIGIRIKYASEHLETSIKEFSDKIGESIETITEWINKGSSKTNLERILAAYPIINRDWLINGNGLPFLDNPQENSALQNTTELSPDELQSLLQQSGIPTTSASAEEREARAYGYMRTINDIISKKDDNLFPQEEKTIPSGGSEIMNQVVQALTSTINSLTAQLSDKDKIIMKQMDHIASLDERIRQLEKLMYQNNLNA